MTPKLRAALKNGMLLCSTRSKEGRSIPGTEHIRRCSILSLFNRSSMWTTQPFTFEIQASMVHAKVKASEGESDLYSSVSSANMWWGTDWWLITSERGSVYKCWSRTIFLTGLDTKDKSETGLMCLSTFDPREGFCQKGFDDGGFHTGRKDAGR